MLVADLILKNANVITIDPRQPSANLVAIKNGKILLVAGNEELESVRGVGTKVIDCRGKTVIPGFNDAHCHVISFIRKNQACLRWVFPKRNYFRLFILL